MTPEFTNLLVQVPLAGIVLFLTLQFLKHLEQGDKNMLSFLAQQAEINRLFLASQREQMNDALGRLAEEIKTLRIELHNGKN